MGRQWTAGLEPGQQYTKLSWFYGRKNTFTLLYSFVLADRGTYTPGINLHYYVIYKVQSRKHVYWSIIWTPNAYWCNEIFSHVENRIPVEYGTTLPPR